MSADPVRIGVVGLNYWGPNLARNVDRLPGAELAWCCDLDEKILVRMSAQFPDAKTTAELDDVLADDSVDAVIVATSVPTHYLLGKRVLEAGKHAFIEKPLAVRAADAEDLVRVAEAHDRRLMVGHLLEYHPAVRKVKELIDAGDLGAYSTSTRTA